MPLKHLCWCEVDTHYIVRQLCTYVLCMDNIANIEFLSALIRAVEKINRDLHIDSSGCKMIFILLKWLLLIQLCITTIKYHHHFIIHTCIVKNTLNTAHTHTRALCISSEVRAWLLWKRQLYHIIFTFSTENWTNQKNIGGKKNCIHPQIV